MNLVDTIFIIMAILILALNVYRVWLERKYYKKIHVINELFEILHSRCNTHGDAIQKLLESQITANNRIGDIALIMHRMREAK